MESANLFWEIHSGLPREAPGHDTCTVKALSMLGTLPENLNILDVGCGPGGQTVCLAVNARDSTVWALDTHQPFLDELRRRAEVCGVSRNVRTVRMSMFELNLPPDYFDMVWAEGSLFIIGFARGLKELKPYIKSGGYLAATELSWLTEDPPVEAACYWRTAYPPMKSVETNLATAASCNFDIVGTFVLPEYAWWDNYFTPMKERIAVLKIKYADRMDSLSFLDEHLVEMEMYKKYGKSYGYVFYLLKKK